MSHSATALRLYVSEECKLCDRAVEVLAQAKAPDFECICIEGDHALEQRYGVRVPVLHDVIEDSELGWPFDVADVKEFLGGDDGAGNAG